MTKCNVFVTIQERERCGAGFLILLPCALLLSLAAPAVGQTRERTGSATGPSILKLHASTRAHALGSAFWPGSGHAVFHHPALISSQGFDLSVGGVSHRDGDGDRDHDSRDRDVGRHHPDDALYTALSVAANWMGGSVSLGLAVLDYGYSLDIDTRRERDLTPAERARLVAAARLRRTSTEFVGVVGYTREAVFGIDVGAAAKVVGQSAGGYGGRAGALDLGMSRDFGRVTAALTVQNLGPDLELAGREVPLPRRLVLGAGTRGRAPAGPLDIGATAQVSYERGGKIVPGGGVEIAYWPIQRRVFIVRVGGVRVVEGDGLPVTFGAGFEGDRIRVDYGYSERDPVVGPHRIGVSIR
ncbi:MAG: hypothetical protein OXI76_17535 [Gemmatimonadota bacterium]|nr:hypothetical protein [Gemmatimonadota bacterium]